MNKMCSSACGNPSFEFVSVAKQNLPSVIGDSSSINTKVNPVLSERNFLTGIWSAYWKCSTNVQLLYIQAEMMHRLAIKIMTTNVSRIDIFMVKTKCYEICFVAKWFFHNPQSAIAKFKFQISNFIANFKLWKGNAPPAISHKHFVTDVTVVVARGLYISC